jgi:hypothetical protein
MRPEQRVLCLAARTQLEGEDERRLVALLRTGIDWERLWTEAASHEVLPLVAASLRRSGDGLMPAGWATRVQRPLYATLLRNTALAEELTMVSSTLRSAGIDSLAVKGVVLAETVYGDLALRPASDVDILVHPADLPAARSVLGSLGFHRRAERLAEKWTHSHHDPRYFRRTARGDVCLELHWALWPSSRFHDDGGLWARSRTVELRGSALRTLSREDTLLHLAIHRTRAPLLLRSVCDVAELLRRERSWLDWDAVQERAETIGARTALYAVLSGAQRLLAAPLPPGVLEALGVGPLRRRILEPASGPAALFPSAPSSGFARQVRTGLRAFEHDGVRAITGSLVRRAARKGDRLLDVRQAWRLTP